MSRRTLYILSLIIFFSTLVTCCSGPSSSHNSYEEEFSEVDEELQKIPIYDAQKENRILNLKKNIAGEKNDKRRQELTDLLISEYDSYSSDSALHYININLDNPIVKSDKFLQISLLIKKADVAAHAGFFDESSKILSQLNKSDMDNRLLEQYYSAYCDLYQYQNEYAVNSEYADKHARLRELYIDSLIMVSSPTSINYIVNYAAAQARSGDYETAEKFLKEKLGEYKSGERSYSILASILADIYRQKGNKEEYHNYISKSVISDIRGAIKENMAMRALATECFEDGDLERADRYLRQSFEDANFYAARMRNAQSSRMLPIIGEAYVSQQKTLNHELRVMIVFISILAFGFVVIAIFAIIQVRRIRKVNRKTKEMLEEVSSLSAQLSELNKDLSKTNQELTYSNAIKGEYAALFMEYSSLAISAMQQYQQSLKVTAMQGNLPSLIKKIDSPSFETKALAEFYSKFDDAILNIYPNFVEKFNSLLNPEDKIELKPKEKLNTELRVFALIRIGITDSEKISRFLRCSLSTVYTYRSKLKKKALNPATFESDLMKI